MKLVPQPWIYRVCNTHRNLLESTLRLVKNIEFRQFRIQTFPFLFSDIYLTAITISKHFENTFKLWAGPFLILVVRDPDDIKIALNSDECFDKPSLIYSPYFSYGLFVMGGDAYKFHRKNINPVLYPACLQSIIPILDSRMQSFMERLDAKLTSKQIEFSHYASDYTLDTILATMFGVDNIAEEARFKFADDVDQWVFRTEKKVFC